METRQLVDKTRQALEGNSRILFAYLFGSRARGDAVPFSDIDVAVYVEPAADLVSEKLEALGALMDSLRTDELDLVILNTASLPLQARVIRDGIVVVDRIPHRRHCFESLVLRKYFDFSRVEEATLKRRFSLG